MTPILERRLDALGRQAVAEATTPLPPQFLNAVHQREASRNALRTTIACAGIGCFLLSGLVAYLLLPKTMETPTPFGTKSVPLVATPGSDQPGDPVPNKDPLREGGGGVQTVSAPAQDHSVNGASRDDRESSVASDHEKRK